MTTLEIYDTTLRDGTQQEGISLTAGDKLAISRLLDELGVAYVEGGWPGANPKDDEFFQRARRELDFTTATLVAFGSTRRAGRPHFRYSPGVISMFRIMTRLCMGSLFIPLM